MSAEWIESGGRDPRLPASVFVIARYGGETRESAEAASKDGYGEPADVIKWHEVREFRLKHPDLHRHLVNLPSEPLDGSELVDASVERKGFWAKCRACAHCWIVAFLPMEIGKAAKLAARAACPMCGDRKPLVARQDDGTLLEELKA